MSNGPVFNIHGNVHQAANTIENKDSHIGDVHNHAPLPSVEEVIGVVSDSVPEEVAESIIPEFKSLASMPLAQMNEPEVSNRIMEMCDAIRPHASTIWKNLAIFGATALETLAKRNPVIAGVMEVCRANSGVSDA